MSRTVVAAALMGWIGLTLVFAETAWARRPSLTARLAPYLPGHDARNRPSSSPLVDVVGPLAEAIGEAAAQLLGIDDSLQARLNRTHSADTPTSFRVRQATICLCSSVIALLGGLAVQLPPAILASFVIGSPVLAFLVIEQRSLAIAKARQARLATELPVVAEQLAMLLSAGWSLGAALTRLAERSHGACGEDLALVLSRSRQGVGLDVALTEWAEMSGSSGVRRLVSILALNQETADLGRLVTEEARQLRRELQRNIVEQIEQRAQLVWIPVTLATLVPGVIFLCIPFLNALQPFTN